MTQETTNTTVASSEQLPVQAPSPKDTFMSFVPIILIFAIFYFFVIRPQMKRQKEQTALIKSAKKGDRVIFAGGLFGKIVKEKSDEILVVEIAKDTQLEILRSSIVSIVNDGAKTSMPSSKT